MKISKVALVALGSVVVITVLQAAYQIATGGEFSRPLAVAALICSALTMIEAMLRSFGFSYAITLTNEKAAE